LVLAHNGRIVVGFIVFIRILELIDGKYRRAKGSKKLQIINQYNFDHSSNRRGGFAGFAE
jgi:hypothetical protein